MGKYFVIKLFVVLLVEILFSAGMVRGQGTPLISKPELIFRNDSLIIHYTFKDCREDQVFRVWLDVTNAEGKKIVPHHLSGDIGSAILCGGDKTVYWDLKADSLFMDDELYVKVVAETEITVRQSTGNRNVKYFFSSLVFPGSGLNMKTGNSHTPYWLMGMVGYGGVATTLYFNQMKKNAYKDWETETDQGVRDDLYQKYEDNKKYMLISAASTGTVWLVNLVWTLVAPASQPGNIALKGKRSLHFETMVFREDGFTPGLGVRYTF